MPEDWRWVGETMTVEINDVIHEATETHGWNYVDGIYEGFRRHGYCADDHWVVRAAETVLIQGDRYGAAHPTAAGHLLYAQRIAANVTPALYRSSDGSQPRAPGYGPHFRRADVNADGEINITDAIHLLGWLFLNGDEPSCAAASDANGSRVIDISDASYILGFLFLGGPPPADPFKVCGPLAGDGDAALGCATTPQACRGQ